MFLADERRNQRFKTQSRCGGPLLADLKVEGECGEGLAPADSQPGSSHLSGSITEKRNLPLARMSSEARGAPKPAFVQPAPSMPPSTALGRERSHTGLQPRASQWVLL